MSDVKEIVPLTRGQARALRFVCAALGDEERPILTYIHQKGADTVEATNGHALHMVRLDGGVPAVLDGFPEGLARPSKTIPATGGDVVFEADTDDTQTTTYPDTSGIIPKGDPVFVVSLDPALLMETLKHVGKSQQGERTVTLAFYGAEAPFEVYGYAGDGNTFPLYALIMPMVRHLTRDALPLSDLWRPGRPPVEEA